MRIRPSARTCDGGLDVDSGLTARLGIGQTVPHQPKVKLTLGRRRLAEPGSVTLKRICHRQLLKGQVLQRSLRFRPFTTKPYRLTGGAASSRPHWNQLRPVTATPQPCQRSDDRNDAPVDDATICSRGIATAATHLTWPGR